MNTQTSSPITVSRVTSKADLQRFIRLPERLHAKDPTYIAPLHMERNDALSPEKNPYFTHAEAVYFLAVRDGRDVGRITAQIDHEALKLEPGIGHFGMIAAEDDPAIFRALIDAAEAWLTEKGMTEIRGPLNLSTNEETGLLIDGFDSPPMLLMGHDLPYVGLRLEQAGFAKVKDVVAYLYDTRGELPESAKRLIKRALHPSMVLRPMDWNRYEEEIKSVTEIFNDAWSGNWGFVPLIKAETEHMAKALKPLLDKKLVWFVEIEGDVAGFIVALPNLNEAIRDLRGKLFPFGWLKLLWRLKVSGVKTARVPLMGVRRRYATSLMGGLIPFLLVDAARRGSLEKGFTQMELSWILEDNKPMRKIIETLGAKTYKTYRVYQKPLGKAS